jgi:hypothetical protein
VARLQTSSCEIGLTMPVGMRDDVVPLEDLLIGSSSNRVSVYGLEGASLHSLRNNRSGSEIAEKVSRPNASRALANACAKNPVSCIWRPGGKEYCQFCYMILRGKSYAQYASPLTLRPAGPPLSQCRGGSVLVIHRVSCDIPRSAVSNER